MEIRNISGEDVPIFLKLCEDFYNSGATKRGFDKENAMITFNQLISKHENLWGYLIVEKQTGIYAGYALITSYWCNEEAGNVIVLDELYIDPKFRHHGYGMLFLQWLESNFKDKAVSVTLEVLSTNVVAKDLYARDGYYEDGFVNLSKRID